MKLNYADTDFEIDSGSAFVPTDTTRVLIDCAIKEVGAEDRLLDLGCGSGVVGMILAQTAKIPKVYLSDVHEESRAAVAENMQRVGQAHDFRVGSLFAPWTGERFDVIVDDVSGVAEPVAKLSRWFQNVPCASGPDGADLVVQVIESAPDYLTAQGKLIFPTISLSNTQRIVDTARARFREVERLGSVQWPLPKELLEHRELLLSLESSKSISLIKKFGMLLGQTDVYVARQ
jgi:cyclopropane fatty-acyl-phospholipid synthase-like methyltransferase